MRGLSLVVASRGHSSSRCAGLSPSRPLLLWSTGSRRAGSAIVAHGPSCSVACGIFPDQGSNLCALHWQADSQPLRHQGSPDTNLFYVFVWLPSLYWTDFMSYESWFIYNKLAEFLIEALSLMSVKSTFIQTHFRSMCVCVCVYVCTYVYVWQISKREHK